MGKTGLSAYRMAALLALSVLAFESSAEMMTVKQVEEYYEGGESEKLAGLSYSQGVFGGLIAFESTRRSEGKAVMSFADCLRRQTKEKISGILHIKPKS